jgi:type IV pilus assembly protein PilW
MTSMTMMHRRTQLGLSLVELMIAMVIGLIVMIVVYQMFVVSEGTRRTSIAGNDAQMSAAIAMSALQDGIRNGGYGLTSFDSVNGVRPLGCDVKGYNAGIGGFINFRLNPVTVGQGADNNAATGVGKDPDSITVVYSDLPYPTVPVNLLSGMTNTTGDLLVTNRFSVTPGDVLIIADNPVNTTPPQAAGATVCALTEATGTPTAPPGPTTLATVRHVTGTYVDLNGNNKLVRFNGPGGIGASAGNPAGLMFRTTASVYNLGPNPAVITFSVQNNQLMMSNLLGNSNQALVDGVVSLQAQYGVGVDTLDSNGLPGTDGFADVFNPSGGQGTWQTVMPANPGLVIAVRLAVLTRANLIEAKDKTTGLCNATPATSPELQWAGGTFDVTGTVDWDCYRYKKFEMVVPLRNIIWMPS